MRLIDINQKLEQLYTRCSAHQYVSHYPIQVNYERLMVACESLDFTVEMIEQTTAYQDLKTKLESKLAQLKESNSLLIRTTEFEPECIRLINANDAANLGGLIDIGEYFGIGPRGGDVVGGLLSVYEWYRTNPGKRTLGNQIALNELCDRLHEPQLPILERNFNLFSDSRKKLDAIIKMDASTNLMVWLLNANQEDIDFALRLSASTDTSSGCLLFLLRRAAPSATDVTVNLLAMGQPSGQIALHRAIRSKTIAPVKLLLESKYNPSTDILRQLLVRDNKNLGPIDLIEQIEDVYTRKAIIDIVKNALTNYQSVPELQLPEAAFHSIAEALNDIASKCEEPGYSI